MDKNFEIRRAAKSDAPAIMEMIMLMAEHEGEADEVENTAEKIADMMDGGLFNAYIVYDGEKPAAYLIYFYTYSTYLGCRNMYIEDIFIRAEYRKCGLGKKVMNFAAVCAKNEGCKRLDWTCIKQNQSAADFYKHLGGKYLEERMYFRAEGAALDKLAE